MIEILEKGFLTLPVTSKRHAFASLGVPAGGPMDSFRYDLANALVGNSADAPALEATLILPGIRFTDRRAFSVVGGVRGITLLHKGEKGLDGLVGKRCEDARVGDDGVERRVEIRIFGKFRDIGGDSFREESRLWGRRVANVPTVPKVPIKEAPA